MKGALLKKTSRVGNSSHKLAGKITESQMSQPNYQVGAEAQQVVSSMSFGSRRSSKIEADFINF